MFTFPVNHFGATVLRITANTNNYNVAAALGNPTGSVKVIVIIESGVIVGSASASVPAFDTGALPAGSIPPVLINKGSIYGAGGKGGDGGDISNTTCSGITAGEQGGPAIKSSLPIIIDNTSGEIFGGGGGGGGGGGSSSGGTGTASHAFGGGGGAGGQGSGSAGGQGGAASGASIVNDPGTNGTAGDNTTAGTAGTISAAGATGNGAYVYGGNGGAWGEAGTAGGTFFTFSDTNCKHTGQPGGEGGFSVDAGGNLKTWLGGNNATQVKGVTA